jgi:hypothetical protein
MLDKINVTGIVRQHVRTLKAYRTGAYAPFDFVIFFVCPLVAAAVLVRFRPVLSADLVGVLATSLSVFAALLFNLILLIYDMLNRGNGSGGKGKLKTALLEEIYNNVSFCILVAIVTLLFLLADFLDIRRPIVQEAIAFVVYYLVGVFVLTLLMVLKRVHILLRKEMA